MRKTPIAVLALALAAAAPPAGAGMKIVRDFRVGAVGGPEALAHLELKAVVAEFLDPGDTGLGKDMGYLVWRETLTAISDQAGAGVILALPPGEERLVDLLARDYHAAAGAIARHQKARMAVWGAVSEEAGEVLIHSYLTVLTPDGGSDLKVHLSTRLPDSDRVPPGALGPGLRVLPDGTLAGSELEAAIPRTRYNFEPVVTTREELFRRPVVTRVETALRAEPRSRAPAVASVPADTALQAVGMAGGWFRVQHGAGHAYVANSQVEVLPRTVDARVRDVNLRAGPGIDHPVLRRADLDGVYPVLDMRYRPGQGLWYRLQIGGAAGWLTARFAQPRFQLPAVHFLAGLYRFYGERFPDAAREFEQFLRLAGGGESNVNRAAAQQLFGASRLALDARDGIARQAFDQAVSLTPFDPAAYRLRAVAELGAGRGGEGAVEDLRHALELDRRDPRTLALAGQMQRLAGADRHPVVNDWGLEAQRRELLELDSRFRLEEPPSRAPLVPLPRRLDERRMPPRP